MQDWVLTLEELETGASLSPSHPRRSVCTLCLTLVLLLPPLFCPPLSLQELALTYLEAWVKVLERQGPSYDSHVQFINSTLREMRAPPLPVTSHTKPATEAAKSLLANRGLFR